MNNPIIQHLLTTPNRSRVSARVSLSNFHQRMRERAQAQVIQERMLATSELADQKSPYSADSLQHARWIGAQLSQLLPKLPSNSVVQVVLHPMDNKSRPMLALTNVRHLEIVLESMAHPQPLPDSISPDSPTST